MVKIFFRNKLVHSLNLFPLSKDIVNTETGIIKYNKIISYNLFANEIAQYKNENNTIIDVIKHGKYKKVFGLIQPLFSQEMGYSRYDSYN